MAANRIRSICTITAIGLICKAALNLGFCSSVTVSGLHHLLNALADAETRKSGRGIVTVANHVSTLDDPVAWGVLPLRCYLNPRDMRWALGASDIMFTNPAFSTFFRNGQVLETFRGGGIYQPAVDGAIKRLDEGGWVHLFGEGKVNQPYQYPLRKDEHGNDIAMLPRFKWGTGRILMETRKIPVIIPMWLSGFEKMMPEPRPQSFPAKFLPSPRQALRVTFAPPIDPTHITNLLHSANLPDSAPTTSPSALYATIDPAAGDEVISDASSIHQSDVNHEVKKDGGDRDPLLASGLDYGAYGETPAKRWVRSALTALIQREVEKVGHAVEGPLLGRPKL